MNCRLLNAVVAVAVLSSAFAATRANAQCCGAPAVAVAQPTVAYYQPQVVAYQEPRMGLFDRWRMRRWGVTPVQPVYSAAYAPAASYTAAYTPYQAAYAYAPTSYTAAYAPATYTAAYAPATYTAAYAPVSYNYTPAYRPYVAAYAPLQTTAYYASTQQVVMSPVVEAAPSACGCEASPCQACGCAAPAPACPSCGGCSACSSGVGQAIYAEPASSCPSCAAAAAAPSYNSMPSAGPVTPQPVLAPSEGAPSTSQYDTNKLEIEPRPADPAPATESNPSTYFEAPKLFSPQDRTASRAAVDVHDAVYREAATYHNVGLTSAPETDANGWHAVSSGR